MMLDHVYGSDGGFWSGVCCSRETFPNEDVPVHAVVQDVALLHRQHGLLEGTAWSHGGDLHGTRGIRDLREEGQEAAEFTRT